MCTHLFCLSYYLQVRELSNESLRLSTSYPGANAAVITSSMEQVQLAWESLQGAANGRKRKLRAAIELQKFLSSVSRTVFFVCVFLDVMQYVCLRDVYMIISTFDHILIT